MKAVATRPRSRRSSRGRVPGRRASSHRQKVSELSERRIAAAIALGLVVLTVVTSHARESWSHDGYWNTDRGLADPAALFAEGQFHVYTTSAAHCVPGDCPHYWVPRFASSSLAGSGSLQGDAMPDRPAWVDAGQRDVWAPAVARIGGRYVMYFAASSGRPPSAGAKCLGLAVAPTPAGPFRPAPEPLHCSPGGYWSIDPYVVSDGTRWFLLWREDDPAHSAGQIVGAELRRDGLGFQGARKRALVAGRFPWEDGIPAASRRPAPGDAAPGDEARLPIASRQDPGVIGPIENPATARHPTTGEWLLTWSANRWETPDYATGLAVCRGPLGPCRRESRERPWLQTSDDEAVRTDAEFTGAGGLSFVTGPDGRLYAVFHAYRPARGDQPRQRIGWVYRVDHTGAYVLSEF